jgi:hypothetical protein
VSPGARDALASVRPVLALASRFTDLLTLSLAQQTELDGFEIRSANGGPAFIALAERQLGRSLWRRKPHPEPTRYRVNSPDR